MHLEFIDIHSHILPGVDDGARDLEQAVAMAVIAAQDGIKTLVATPHVMKGAFDNHRDDIIKKVKNLNLCLQVQQIKLLILPGAEYHLELDLPERLAAGQLLTINDTGRYLLVELPSTSVPEYTGNILQALLSQGVTPVIAHPERNKQLQQDPDILERFGFRGILAQVTSNSITGLNGRAARDSALKFIQTGAAQLVASDAHSARTRAPVMSTAFAEIEKRWGRDFAQLLFCDNPWRVIRGLPLVEVDPLIPEESPRTKFSLKNGIVFKKLKIPWGQAPTR